MSDLTMSTDPEIAKFQNAIINKEEGIFYGIPDPLYFAAPAFSQSKLKKYLVSPRGAMLKPDDISLEAQVFGHALEVAVWQPEQFDDIYYPSQYETYCKGMDKESLSFGGRIGISKSHYPILKNIDEALRLSECYHDVKIREGKYQVVLLWWQDEVYCKAKLDKVSDEGDQFQIYDLKSFTSKKDISVKSLGWHCKDYGYDIQAAFYLDAYIYLKKLSLGSGDFVNVFCEKAENPEIIGCTIGESNLDAGREKIKKGLAIYRETLKNEHHALEMTCEYMMLREQNADVPDPAKFVTLSWFEVSYE